jgi:hypothetical protein
MRETLLIIAETCACFGLAKSGAMSDAPEAELEEWRQLRAENIMTGEDIVSRYAWLDTSRRLGMCITYVRGRDEDAVIRRFGGDPATARPMSLSDVEKIGMWQERSRMRRLFGEDLSTARPMSTRDLRRQSRRESRNIDNTRMEEYLPLRARPIVLTDQIGDWAVILEDGGYQGTRDEVARQVSKGTEMVSVYWDAKALKYFLYAVDGEVITKFELGGRERSGSDPDRLNAQMAGLPFEPGKLVASALALAERITGVEFKQDWLHAKRRGVVVTPLPKDWYHSSFSLRPEVNTAIRGASMMAQRRIASLAAERAAKELGLDGDQTLRDALEALRNPAADLTIARANLAPLVQRFEIEELLAIERSAAELGRLPRRQFNENGGPPIIIMDGVERIRPIGGIGVDETTQKSEAYQEQRKIRRQTAAGYAVYNALLPDSLTAAIQAVSAASLAVSDSESLFRDALSLANAPPER